jgi:nicotinate-nucleotide adenylyltransferase
MGVRPLGSGAVTADRPVDGAAAGLDDALGVFGGTFDPIHLAHLAVAETARDALRLEQVLFIPAGEPPHKVGRPISPAEDRLAMVRAAIADNAAFAASRMELDRGGPSYTVDTLRDLRAARLAEGRSSHLALILSVDSFMELPTWHDPEGVLGLATLVVAPRDGYAEATPDFLERAFPGVGGRAVFLDGPRLRLSASELRARAKSGRTLRYLVPDAVAAYIGDHGLYQDPRRTART